MIQQQTVFVLGAGASSPYGFPLGRTLVDQICNCDRDTMEMLKKFGEVDDFLMALKATRPDSIDVFLENRSEFINIGKAAIAAHIIRHESQSVFNQPPQPERWYDHLFNTVMRSSFDVFKDNNLAVVTFNYDRSLEHFLFYRLVNAFGVQADAAVEQLSHIRIIHVHGKIGMLPSEPGGDSNSMRPYSAEVTLDTIRIATAGIQVITEANEESSEFGVARELVSKARKVFFLGFGFHPENMRRLGVPLAGSESFDVPTKFYGTAKGMVQAEIEKINNRYAVHLKLVPERIDDFMRRDSFLAIHD